MKLLLATFGYCVASALIPVINAEAYVAGVGVLFHGAAIWGVAATAAGGQMVGKVVYFLLGRKSLEWQWVRTKLDTPKRREALERWRQRIGDRLWMAGLVLFASALLGVPPFLVLAVLAGQLRVPLPLFVAVGFLGRLGRFAIILGLAGVAVTLF